MATTVNETVGIAIHGPDGEYAGVFSIPAFTQDTVSVCQRVQLHLIDYGRESEANDTPTSVGDFILWLIRRASETEPLESEYDND